MTPASSLLGVLKTRFVSALEECAGHKVQQSYHFPARPRLLFVKAVNLLQTADPSRPRSPGEAEAPLPGSITGALLGSGWKPVLSSTCQRSSHQLTSAWGAGATLP